MKPRGLRITAKPKHDSTSTMSTYDGMMSAVRHRNRPEFSLEKSQAIFDAVLRRLQFPSRKRDRPFKVTRLQHECRLAVLFGELQSLLQLLTGSGQSAADIPEPKQPHQKRKTLLQRSPGHGE